jgi:RNA polymerase sigma-70 factor (ECF subfamily)
MSLGRPNASDELLLSRYREGDKSAFAELVRRHQSALYNFALRQLRSTELAEDVVQEAFVRVVQGVHDFKQESRFTTWVYTIVRNLCIDQMRKNALRRHASLDESKDREGDGPTLLDQTADPTAGTDRKATSNELGVRITAAVETLPDEQREVFLMREVSNLPFKEIAQIIGVPENTVKSRMRYALERLKEALDEYEDLARALK